MIFFFQTILNRILRRSLWFIQIITTASKSYTWKKPKNYLRPFTGVPRKYLKFSFIFWSTKNTTNNNNKINKCSYLFIFIHLFIYLFFWRGGMIFEKLCSFNILFNFSKLHAVKGCYVNQGQKQFYLNVLKIKLQAYFLCT